MDGFDWIFNLKREGLVDISDTTVEPVDPRRWLIIRLENIVVVL